MAMETSGPGALCTVMSGSLVLQWLWWGCPWPVWTQGFIGTIQAEIERLSWISPALQWSWDSWPWTSLGTIVETLVLTLKGELPLPTTPIQISPTFIPPLWKNGSTPHHGCITHLGSTHKRWPCCCMCRWASSESARAGELALPPPPSHVPYSNQDIQEDC